MNKIIAKENKQLLAKRRKQLENLLREADPLLFDYILEIVAGLTYVNKPNNDSFDYVIQRAFTQALIQVQYERVTGKNDVLRFK